MIRDIEAALTCPVPFEDGATVLLAHGGGGRLTRDLIERVFLPRFRNRWLEPLHDGALLDRPESRLAFTTDSFVVRPLFFPGGDIGSLAVHGTINDLAMCGARPLGLSAGFIIEEGLPVSTLDQVVASMAEAAGRAGVPVVTGDTKVVDRGKADGLYINTSGIGLVADGLAISPSAARPGDAVLVSGTVGNHGIAVLSAREGLEFEADVRSDSAPLWGLVEAVLGASREIRCLRDPTRGGLATVLLEIAASSGAAMRIDERAVPIEEGVRAACEILGLDPLYVPCEGRFCCIVAGGDADRVLAALRSRPDGRAAARIGEVVAGPRGSVTLRTPIGGERALDLLSGEQLPRIC
jgi:hydrogenase expression/formation protein HypE